MKFRLSLSAGLIEWKVDGNQLTFTDPDDPASSGNVMRSLMPDAKFGFLFYNDKWHFGGAAPNLIQNRINFFDEKNPISKGNKLEDHYFIHGGYDFILPYDLVADPYILMRYVSNVPLQFEFGSTITWKSTAWAGFSYRTEDAFLFYWDILFKIISLLDIPMTLLLLIWVIILMDLMNYCLEFSLRDLKR